MSDGGAAPPKVVAAAIKVGQLVCVVERPGRHGDVFVGLRDAEVPKLIGGRGEQGFIDSDGRFLSRGEALSIAQDAQQMKANRGSRHNPDQLYSEDVW